MRLSAVWLAGALCCLGAGCARGAAVTAPPADRSVNLPAALSAPPASAAPGLSQAGSPPVPPPFLAPIEGASGRVTKKPFGLYVTPKDSPVSPERFSGYHTGADFETTPAEQAIDVPIRAACDGTLALKEYASGYGGVAVERCTLGAEAVTVIYGHLRLSSVQAKTGQALRAGEAFAMLGTGFSRETDGERKHLHFGVHRGQAIVIKGYVTAKSALGGWLDPLSLIE